MSDRIAALAIEVLDLPGLVAELGEITRLEAELRRRRELVVRVLAARTREDA